MMKQLLEEGFMTYIYLVCTLQSWSVSHREITLSTYLPVRSPSEGRNPAINMAAVAELRR